MRGDFVKSYTQDAEQRVEISSPDSSVRAAFAVGTHRGMAGRLTYTVEYKGIRVLDASQLAFEFADSPSLDGGLAIVDVKRSSHHSTWKPVYGERSVIPDHYNEAVIELVEVGEPHRDVRLTCRVYNEGVAFCFTFGKTFGDVVSIDRETVEFCFVEDHTTWATYTAQGPYEEVTISQVRSGCERPLTVRVADNCFASICEARLVDYARMKLAPREGRPNCLVSELSGRVVGGTPLTTPWRVIVLGDSAGQLLERNYIILNLNDPCALDDVSWIRPGKVIRDTSLSTVGGKACVDLAVKYNLQFVEFDCGWYGPEFSPESDARFVNVDPRKYNGPLDLHEVIKYADERGVGVILYVNHIALERQADELFPLYHEWGVKGVKFGFVNVGPQEWTSWLHEAVRKAAQHRLMVDIHDEYRPTGYSRTYPNLITQEGIRGDEERQPTWNFLVTLFTRMIAGAADVTVCYYDERVDQLWSHGFQLAKSVVFYSPWHFLFWYDRPRAAWKDPDSRRYNVIGDEPELEFFAAISTVWDDTRILNGEIGRYATVARKKGSQWFIGSMNSSDPRSLSVSLDFLETGVTYSARIYYDDPTVNTRTRVGIRTQEVNASSVLDLKLEPNSGCAIWLAPTR